MKRFVTGTLLAIVLVVVLVLPVLAIADPDTPPQIGAVYVYEDLLEDGDTGVLVDIYLDYAVNPDETATEAYLVTFIDGDGVTQLQSVAPYNFAYGAFGDDGYGRNLVWMYFTEAETTSYSLSSGNVTDYEIWLAGNPTLDWAGDPPKTTAGIDYWQPMGDTAFLVASMVLHYAQVLGNIWSLDMIEETSIGDRLAVAGESYFENVITDLRTIAPGAFSAGTYQPVMEDTDFSTSFGATMTDLDGTVVGSPITLAEGANTVNVTVSGNFTLELNRGTVGTVANDTGTVTGSPVDIVYGTNTIEVPGGGTGTLTVTVNLVNTQTAITDTVTGTAFDLTTIATRFGMSRLMFSGLIWMAITAVICSSTYKVSERSRMSGNAGKIILLVFDVCIIGGALLGLLSMLVAALLFIGFGALTGYVLFFRGANV